MRHCGTTVNRLHLVHTTLWGLATRPDPDRCEELRAAYNPVRRAGSPPAPPFEEWQGTSSICEHPYCRYVRKPCSESICGFRCAFELSDIPAAPRIVYTALESTLRGLPCGFSNNLNVTPVCTIGPSSGDGPSPPSTRQDCSRTSFTWPRRALS